MAYVFQIPSLSKSQVLCLMYRTVLPMPVLCREQWIASWQIRSMRNRVIQVVLRLVQQMKCKLKRRYNPTFLWFSMLLIYLSSSVVSILQLVSGMIFSLFFLWTIPIQLLHHLHILYQCILQVQTWTLLIINPPLHSFCLWHYTDLWGLGLPLSKKPLLLHLLWALHHCEHGWSQLKLAQSLMQVLLLYPWPFLDFKRPMFPLLLLFFVNFLYLTWGSPVSGTMTWTMLLSAMYLAPEYHLCWATIKVGWCEYSIPCSQ